MTETVELKDQKPQGDGTAIARQLRAGGRIPAVLYGHKQDTVALTVSAEDLMHAIRHGHRFVDLKVDGHGESALVAEVQWDHLGKDVLHVDFKRVARDERVK